MTTIHKQNNFDFSIIILAAGRGVRMLSKLPKMLQPIGGRPMLEHVVLTAESLSPREVVVVSGQQGESLKEALNLHTELLWREQKEPLGTGHAVLQALPAISSDYVLILCGDTPLITPQMLSTFIALVKDQSSQIGFITANVFPPTGLGRVIRDKAGKVLKVVEEKEASLEEKHITEINTGIFWGSRKRLETWLPSLSAENAQKEYYLTDIIALALQEKLDLMAYTLQPEASLDILGINTRKQMSLVERIYQGRQADHLMNQGVTLLDPARLDVRGEVTVGRDITIDANVILQGKVVIEDEVYIGPNVVIKDSIIQQGAEILANSVIEGATIGPQASIGPFARIRPGTVLKEKVKIGNFVEIKQTKVERGSKINHLSYVGDAIVGKSVNIGAGTITCNYDGKDKYQTIIGDKCFIGSDTQLIAPVTIGEDVTIGAGTTVVKDVPPHHLIHNKVEHRMVLKPSSEEDESIEHSQKQRAETPLNKKEN